MVGNTALNSVTNHPEEARLWAEVGRGLAVEQSYFREGSIRGQGGLLVSLPVQSQDTCFRRLPGSQGQG